MVRLASALLVAVGMPALGTQVAQAQPGGPGLHELVDSDPFSEDPIGIDSESDLHRVPIAAPAPPAEDPAVVASRGPRPPAVEPAAGAALTAIPGVREVDHRTEVILADGLAEVETRMRFVNGARHRAELRYHLPVPAGSEPAGLEVCVGGACRLAEPDPSTGPLSAYDDAVRARGPGDREARLPVAHVRREESDGGTALVVRAAPLDANGGELEVRLRWVAPAPVTGGVVRFRLPARGRDPRAAPGQVRVTAEGLLAPSVDGRPASDRVVTVEPWVPIEITARLATNAQLSGSAWHFACGDRRCARVRVAAGPRQARPVDLVVLVDASPSMEGPARGRVAVAVAALLASAPPGSRVRAAVFGARAEPILTEPTPADRVRLAPFAEAAMRSLGAATRFERAWELVGPWLAERSPSHRPRVVLVGDGGLQSSEASRRAFATAARAGVEVSVLNVADRSSWEALADGARRTGGIVVEAGAAADRASRGRGSEPLEEAVAALFAPVVARRVQVGGGGSRVSLGPLRAGEELVWQGEIGRGVRAWLAAGGLRRTSRPAEQHVVHGLATAAAGAAGRQPTAALVAVDDTGARGDAPALRCEPLGPPRLASGVSSDAAPVAVAEARTCEPTSGSDTDGAGTGVPGRTLLTMLRQRVVPAARLCFRRDRAGRADYSVRATFHFRLADREVIEADVEGRIEADLRQCLLEAVHDLDVPRFDGTVVVRYPVFTEREPRPPTIELEPEVARRVDHILR